MRRDGLRVVLAGASGALGSEVARVLGEQAFPLAELYPFATDRSLGGEVEVADEAFAVETAPPSLRGYDLMFLCTPRSVALDLVREALRAELPCIDCTGALARSSDVPLGLADRSPAAELVGAPVIAAPSGPALSWGRVLAGLDELGGLERVRGTVVQTASAAGRDGIDTLSEETLSLLSGQDPPAPSVFATGVAFDCVPGSPVGVRAEGADEGIEEEVAAVVRRLVGRDVPLSLGLVQSPAFVGEGSQLFCELSREVDPQEVEHALGKLPGLRRFEGNDGGLPGPTTRDASGEVDVLVGPVRADPAAGASAEAHPEGSGTRGLRLWVASDPVAVAASNAVKLAEARLRRH